MTMTRTKRIFTLIATLTAGLSPLAADSIGDSAAATSQASGAVGESVGGVGSFALGSAGVALYSGGLALSAPATFSVNAGEDLINTSKEYDRKRRKDTRPPLNNDLGRPACTRQAEGTPAIQPTPAPNTRYQQQD